MQRGISLTIHRGYSKDHQESLHLEKKKKNLTFLREKKLWVLTLTHIKSHCKGNIYGCTHSVIARQILHWDLKGPQKTMHI